MSDQVISVGFKVLHQSLEVNDTCLLESVNTFANFGKYKPVMRQVRYVIFFAYFWSKNVDKSSFTSRLSWGY